MDALPGCLGCTTGETMCTERVWPIILYAAMLAALLVVVLALRGTLPAARHLLTLDLALAWWLGRCQYG